MAQVDRIHGLIGTLGYKAPCRAATTGNITLYGAQTIDGVAVVAGDAVLVRAQTDSVDNGIWICQSSTWYRREDFDGSRDVVTGTQVLVTEGTLYLRTAFRVTTTGDITIGTSAVTFAVSRVLDVFTSDEFDGVAQDAADAALGKGLILRPGEDVVIAVPSQVATVDTALDDIAAWIISADASVTIQVTGHVTAAGTIGTVAHPYASRIKLRGATPLERTISSVGSVGGTAGAWSVTATLDDGTGISIGDMVLVRDVTPGVLEPGSYPSRPGFGQLNLGFFEMGYLTTVGTAATMTGTAGATYLQDGDLVLVAGQARAISSVGASAFTLSSALADDVTSLQYWYHLDRSGQGTIEVSGSTVTGSGTLFLSQANVNDIIFIDGYSGFLVTAITDDTHLTIDRNVTVGAGANYGFMISGEFHEGAHIVTGVSGNDITWTNKGRTALSKPPVNRVNGGNVYVLPSVVTAGTAGSGLVCETGQIDVDNIGLVGDGNTGSVGIDLRGSGNFSASAKLGTRVGVANFGYGYWGHGGSKLFAQDAMFSGNTTRGLNCTEGARAEVQRAVISGNVGLGILIGPGAYARMSDTRFWGNSGDGVRMVAAGAETWWDFGYSGGNGGMGLRGDGSCLVHHVGARIFKNTEGGVQSDNGLHGRGTGSLILCNQSSGINLAHSIMEIGQITVVGNVTGVLASRSRVHLGQSGIAYNSSSGLRTQNAADVTADDCAIVGNASAILAESASRVYAPDCGFAANTSGITAQDAATVWVQGYTGTITPLSPATLNQWGTDWGVIYNGADSGISPKFESLELSGAGLFLTGIASPAQLTGDTNNYDPTGFASASTLRVTTDASRNLTGLVAGNSGRVVVLENIGSFDLVLKSEDANSTAANRFAIPADITLAPKQVALLMYDVTTARWRAIASARPITTVAQSGIVDTGVGLTLINGTLVPSVGSSALTVAIKTLAGADPSSTDPVHVIFRDATIANGGYSKITITAATSVVVSSGSTLGTSNSTAFRLWVVGFNDGGTFRLGVVNAVSGSNVMPLRPDIIASATAEGGAGAADSAQVIYAGSAVTSKALTLLGYLTWESGLATAGAWSAVPTKAQLFGHGVPCPGDTIQTQRNFSGALIANMATQIPLDDTIPQNTEGVETMTQAITPTSAANLLHIEHAGCYFTDTASRYATVALFQDTTAGALAAMDHYFSAQANTSAVLTLQWLMKALTTSATTFKTRAGMNSTGNMSFNGTNSSRMFGGSLASFLRVSEIQG